MTDRREYLKLYMRAWRLRHPDKVEASRQKQRERGHTPAAKAYKKANRERLLVASRARRARNAEAERQYQRDWAAANPDKIRAKSARRRAAGQISAADIRTLFEMSDGCCAYCLTGPAQHVEHVLPVARGGLSTLDNLVMACRACNLKKGTRTPLEFLMAG